jgi:hypothetical protein
VVSREFYKARLGQFLLEQPNWCAAILFYLIHALGIVVFAAPLAASWGWAALWGALFGFCVYAAYDLTNLATLRGWPPDGEPRRSRLGRRGNGSRHCHRIPGDARGLRGQRASLYSG